MSELEKVGNISLSMMVAIGYLGMFVPLTGTSLAVKSLYTSLLPFLLFVLLSLHSASLLLNLFPLAYVC